MHILTIIGLLAGIFFGVAELLSVKEHINNIFVGGNGPNDHSSLKNYFSYCMDLASKAVSISNGTQYDLMNHFRVCYNTVS